MSSSKISRRVDELFTEVSAVDRSERETLLDQLRLTESSEVMSELEALLVADERVDKKPDFLANSPFGQLLQRVRLNDNTLARPIRLSQNEIELGFLIAAVHFDQDVLTLGELFAVLGAWIESDEAAEFPSFLESQFPDRIAQINAAIGHTLQLLSQYHYDPPSAFRSLACQNSILNAMDQIESELLRGSLLLFARRAAESQLDGDPGEIEKAAAEDGSRFVIRRFLAEGGLGRVSVAIDTQFQRQVALKEIRHELRRDETSHHRLMREAEITGKLEHPGVVPVYACETRSDGTAYYAMRLVDGKSFKQAIDELYQRVAAGCAKAEFEHTLRKLIIRFVDVCQTMSYVHQQGILHRDLKPANIMLGNHGETLVVDWGLASMMESAEATSFEVGSDDRVVMAGHDDAPRRGAILGTPAFTSPEQLEGTVKLDQRSDVYSLGATLYVILTGKRPFDSLSKKLLIARSYEVPRPTTHNPRAPRALEAICLKAMSWNREDRYSTADELAEDVQRWLAFEPVKAWTEPISIRMTRWGQRHLGILSASGVGLLLVAITSIVFVLKLSQQNHKLEDANDDLRVAYRQIAAKTERVDEVVDRLDQIVRVAQNAGMSNRTKDLKLLETFAPEFPTGDLQDWATRAMARPELLVNKYRDLSGQLRLRDSGLDELKIRVAFTKDGQHYAASDSSGNITIFRSSDDQEIRLLRGVGMPIYYVLRFSPSGRYLAAKTNKYSPVYVWDLDTDDPDFAFSTDTLVSHSSFDFNPIRDEFVIGRQGQLEIWSLADRSMKSSIPYEFLPKTITFSPNGESLSIVIENLNVSHILNLSPGHDAPVELAHEKGIFDTAWHPSSLYLATVTLGGDLCFWDVTQSKTIRCIPVGRISRAVAFSQRGDLVATKQNDGSIALWDFATGDRLANAQGGNSHGRGRAPDTLKFSQNDTLLTHGNVNGVLTTWGIAPRALTNFVGSMGGLHPIDILYHGPTGLVLTVFDDGIRFWDPLRQLEIKRMPMSGVKASVLTPSQDALVLANESELFRLPLHWAMINDVIDLKVGPSQRLHAASNIRQVQASAEGELYFIADSEVGAHVCRWNEAEGVEALADCAADTQMSIGPKSQLIALGSESQGSLQIMDGNGQRVHDLTAVGQSFPAFSPDGFYLTVVDQNRLRIIQCADWQPVCNFDVNNQSDEVGCPVAFSESGSWFASRISPLSLQIIETSTGNVLANLDCANDEEAVDFCFDTRGAKLFLLPTFSNHIMMWELDRLAASITHLGLESSLSFAAEVFSNQTDTSLPRRVSLADRAESDSSTEAIADLVHKEAYEQAIRQLVGATRSDAAQIEPWMSLLLLKIWADGTEAYSEMRSDVLARFSRLASAREANDLSIVCYLSDFRAIDEPFLERLNWHAPKIPMNSAIRPRHELMMGLRQWRVRNKEAALDRCNIIRTSEQQMGAFVVLAADILRAIIYAESNPEVPRKFSEEDFRRRIHELELDGTPWTDRLIAEILLRELVQTCREADQSDSVLQ